MLTSLNRIESHTLNRMVTVRLVQELHILRYCVSENGSSWRCEKDNVIVWFWFRLQFSMSEKSFVKNENSGWIRKESKSRPNQFYLFNTKTGESRWDESTGLSTSASADPFKNSPTKSNNKSSVKTVKKTSPSIPQNATQSKEKKVSSKSREGEWLKASEPVIPSTLWFELRRQQYSKLLLLCITNRRHMVQSKV